MMRTDARQSLGTNIVLGQVKNVLEKYPKCPGYVLKIVFQKRVATLAYDLEHFLPHFDFNVLDILISLYYVFVAVRKTTEFLKP